MSTVELYDVIGRDYARGRGSDPRIADRILRALEDAESVLNVGAGTGSYEPADRQVVAVEPSRVMIRQRPLGAAPVVRAMAERLPFRAASFDASLAILTLHHWGDVARGLEELRRVARKTVVILTVDPDASGFWLTDYFPEIREIDRQAMPALSALERGLGPMAVSPVLVPHDCADGFLAAAWRRPRAYLDEATRAAISVFARLERLEEGLARLRADLASGAWLERYGSLLEATEFDAGYRLVVARREPPEPSPG